MDIFEILASIAGLLFYWFLSSRKKSEDIKKPSQTDTPKLDYDDMIELQEEEERKRVEEEEIGEEEEEGADELKELSFKELIRQFENKDGKGQQKQDLKKSAIDVKGSEEKAKGLLGEHLAGSVEKRDVKKAQEMKYRTKYKQKVKKRPFVKEMLKNNATMRNAFIVKEIIDKKFD